MRAPRVLVVEDHPQMRESLVRVLEMEGMDVNSTDRGEFVFKQMKRSMPDVVVLDVDLAGRLTGLDVLQTIRSHPRIGELPVILHTSESGITAAPEADMADLMIMKPADPDELVLMINRLLHMRYSQKTG